MLSNRADVKWSVLLDDVEWSVLISLDDRKVKQGKTIWSKMSTRSYALPHPVVECPLMKHKERNKHHKKETKQEERSLFV